MCISFNISQPYLILMHTCLISVSPISYFCSNALTADNDEHADEPTLIVDQPSSLTFPVLDSKHMCKEENKGLQQKLYPDERLQQKLKHTDEAALVVYKPSLTFPILDLKRMCQEEKERLQQKLYSESYEIMYKFQELFSATVESLKERKVHSKAILSHLATLGSVEPVYKDMGLPVLRRILPDLRKIDDIDEVMQNINDYCSYFNSHMLERIIDKLGTDKDRANLSRYQEEFYIYAERHVFMCPAEVGIENNCCVKMLAALDNTHDNCTLSHLQVLIANFRKILNISDVELRLCKIELGSICLIFQIPLDLQQLFPLSKEQEVSLAKLGIMKLSCGNYVYNQELIQVQICMATVQYIVVHVHFILRHTKSGAVILIPSIVEGGVLYYECFIDKISQEG